MHDGTIINSKTNILEKEEFFASISIFMSFIHGTLNNMTYCFSIRNIILSKSSYTLFEVLCPITLKCTTKCLRVEDGFMNTFTDKIVIYLYVRC